MLYPTLSTIQESMSNIGHSMNLFSNFLNIFIVCALFHSSLHSFGFLRTKPELEPQCRWTTIGGNLEFFLLIEFEKKFERVEWLLRRKCIKKYEFLYLNGHFAVCKNVHSTKFLKNVKLPPELLFPELFMVKQQNSTKQTTKPKTIL